MPTVTPTLNLPQPATSSSAPTKAGPAPAPVAGPAAMPLPAAKMPDAPSATVTLSPQALSALAVSGHPSASPSSTAASSTPAAPSGSVYDSLKNGISTAVTDVGDAIAGGAHAVVDGVETVFSTANDVAKGLIELPFAAVAKASDVVGALIDDL